MPDPKLKTQQQDVVIYILMTGGARIETVEPNLVSLQSISLAVDQYIEAPCAEAAPLATFYVPCGETISLKIDDVDVELSGSAFVDWRVPNLDNASVFASGGYNFTRSDWQGVFGLHVYLD